MMSYWGSSKLRRLSNLLLICYTGYKFESLSLIPQPWDATSRSYIDGREEQVVNNFAQYCSVVRTGYGKIKMVLGGEVDAGESGSGRPSVSFDTNGFCLYAKWMSSMGQETR